MNITLHEIAQLVQGKVIGDSTTSIYSLSAIDNITSGSLVFADGEKNLKTAESSEAAAVLVNLNTTYSHKPLIQVPHPFQAFIKLLHHFNPTRKINPGVHSTAVVGDDVHLGDNVTVGPYVIIESGSSVGDNCVLLGHIYIGHNVTIGANTRIHPQVTVYDNSQIGQHVIIHASTVIGSDGFGYIFVEGQHLKVPHIGRVVIDDHVEIGANTAIDRATMGETVIGEGTKIDNLVQVAHSVKLGKHNILCAFTGIAGSTTSGNNVIFAANVGVSDHVRIDDGVILGARSGVASNKHLKEGIVYFGSPARPKDIAMKHELSINRIPLILKNIKTLTEQVAQLNRQLSTEETE